jgi:hypothetical protein
VAAGSLKSLLTSNNDFFNVERLGQVGLEVVVCAACLMDYYFYVGLGFAGLSAC